MRRRSSCLHALLLLHYLCFGVNVAITIADGDITVSVSSVSCQSEFVSTTATTTTTTTPTTTTTTAHSDEAIALKYITTAANLNEATTDKAFRVHGWRWHTMSVLRELRLLQSTTVDAMEQAVNHVLGFNMKGLQLVEESLFFPWLKDTFNLIPDESTKRAFQGMLRQLTDHHELLVEQGKFVTDSVLQSSLNEIHIRTMIQSMVSTIEEISRIQNDFIVPAVSILVSEKDQVSFNTKVLRHMGILDSRLYLCGMHEAVQGHPLEMELFDKEIPMIPRYMIPRWKRNLYHPRTQLWMDQAGDEPSV